MKDELRYLFYLRMSFVWHCLKIILQNLLLVKAFSIKTCAFMYKIKTILEGLYSLKLRKNSPVLYAYMNGIFI